MHSSHFNNVTVPPLPFSYFSHVAVWIVLSFSRIHFCTVSVDIVCIFFKGSSLPAVVELVLLRLLADWADIFSDHVSNWPEIIINIQKLSDVRLLLWAPHKPSYHKEFRNPSSWTVEWVIEITLKNLSGLKCVFCGQGHWSDECPKYTQRARMDRLKGSCFRCLQRGHVGKECLQHRNCFHYGKNNHHRSSCAKLFANTDRKSSESELHTVSIQTHTEKSEGATIAWTNQVLMQTATTTVMNNPHNKSTHVKMILDSGSQRTYCI